METAATELRQVASPTSLPDGIYDGVWGGYIVRFSVDGVEYEARTEIGIRTLRAPCRVSVMQGIITVSID